MKNLKKLASLALTLTMAAGTIPSVFATKRPSVGGGGGPKTTALEFMENFEDYEVGVIKEIPGDGIYTTGTFGNIEYSLYPGDKIEIAEENGNKYLKFTRENDGTSATSLKYLFPEVYSGGKYAVSYDFKPEVHSKNFGAFGTLIDSKKDNLQSVLSYSGNIYVHNNTVNDWYIYGIVNSSAYKAYSTLTQEVDFTKTADNYNYYSNYIQDDGIVKSAVKTKTITKTEMAGLKWNVSNSKNGGSWNGLDKNDDNNPTNASIYRIDNIVVEKIETLSEDNMKITEDFEGYTEKQYLNRISNALVTTGNSDKVEIATDPVTGSKAIKITKTDSVADTTRLVFDYGEVSGKPVKLSYDVRFENHSKLLQGFPVMSTGMTWINYQSDFYWAAQFNGDTVYASYAKIANDTAVQHVEITHDPNSETENTTATVTKANGKVYTDSYTAGVGKAFQTVTFNTAYTTHPSYVSHMGKAEGDGVYWIDNISVEIVALNLENSNIKAGDINVPVNKDLVLTFNEAVSEAIKEQIMITKGTDVLVYGEDYTVTLSDDAKTVTIEAISGEWDYETTYEVVIPTVEGIGGITPYQGTIINFVTGKYSPVLVDDDFSYLTVGDKWEAAKDAESGKTVQIGDNVNVALTPGDSVEYAYDEVRGQYGLKLTKGSGVGDMDFRYVFPENYVNGKYRVTVDERVEHHSKAHIFWPALTDGSGNRIGYALYGAGYWIEGTGAFNQTDRFGVNWTSVANSRWIAGYGAENAVVGEFITSTGYRYGTYNPATKEYSWSKEPATTVDSLGGVLMRMKWNGSSSADYGSKYIPGSAKATEENPDNDGIAWIYSVKAEAVGLEVASTSFADSQLEFDPSAVLTVTFNEALDISSVNANTFKLYKGSDLIDSYEYNVSLSGDGKTVTLSPVAGLEYGTNYTINISKDVLPVDNEIGGLREEKNYTIKTVEYVDTVNPDIIWSTIPEGSENVDYNTESIILSTNDVLLDEETVTKDNIKVYENGTAIDTYSVSVEENFAVKVVFDGLKKGASYKITVAGLKSGGSNALEMTTAYELNFTTNEDIYIENLTSKISVDGEKSVITAELFNRGETDVTYKVIGVLKDAEGKILSVNYGSEGTLVSGGYTDVTVEADKNENAAYFDLYIWDGIGTMKPLIKKAELNSVNERTYGYDNFADSSRAVRIAFIGGSITQQGHYTTPLKASLATYLKKDNAEREVKFVNHSVDGGVGGTGSDLGLVRLEKDVISKNPDIVFIEFAVNDTSNTNTQKTLEGMVRKLMKLDHQPVVILLNNTTKGFASLDTIDAWQDIISAYGIGSVNVAEYLKANVASEENPDGAFVWKTEDLATYANATVLTSDGTHPNAEGGKIYADFMYKTLTDNPESFFKKMNYVEDPLSGYEYNNPRMISWREAEFDDNWKLSTEMKWAFGDGVAEARKDGATLTLKFTGTTIGLYAPRSVNGGKASYSIDNGAKTGTVSINSGTTSKMEMGSWIASDLAEGEHTITITVDSLGDKYFKFGYFIVD